MSVTLENEKLVKYNNDWDAFEYDVYYNGKKGFHSVVKVDFSQMSTKTKYNKKGSLNINAIDKEDKFEPLMKAITKNKHYKKELNKACEGTHIKCKISKSCKLTEQMIDSDEVTIQTDNDKLADWLIKDTSTKYISLSCYKVRMTRIRNKMISIKPVISITNINKIIPIMNSIKLKDKESLIKFSNRGKIGMIKVFPTIFDNNIKVALPLTKVYNSGLRSNKNGTHTLIIADWGINTYATKALCGLANLFSNEINYGKSISWSKYKNYNFTNNLRYLPSVDHTFVATESDQESDDEEEEKEVIDKWWKKPYAQVALSDKVKVKVYEEIRGSEGEYSFNYLTTIQLKNKLYYGTCFYAIVTPYIYVLPDKKIKGYKMYLNEIYITKTNTPPEVVAHKKIKQIVSSGTDVKLAKDICIEI